MSTWQWIVAIAVVALLFGVGLNKRSGVAEETRITSSEAHTKVKEGARLVDVRTPREFAQGHVEGAINIPLQALQERLDELTPKDQTIILYCRSGNRSAQAAELLRGAGFNDVHDRGPMSAW